MTLNLSLNFDDFLLQKRFITLFIISPQCYRDIFCMKAEAKFLLNSILRRKLHLSIFEQITQTKYGARTTK